MGVTIGGGQEEKITFSCDHQGCTNKSVRLMHPHWYDQQTGQTHKVIRSLRKPFAYWAKVLRKPRRTNVTAFFLLGSEDGWPKKITVFCEKHYRERTAPKDVSPKKWSRGQSFERYRNQRSDIFD